MSTNSEFKRLFSEVLTTSLPGMSDGKTRKNTFFDVSELKVDSEKRSLKTTLKNLCSQWQLLDRSYPFSSSSSTNMLRNGSNSVGDDTNTSVVSEQDREVYLLKLAEIVNQVPKVNANEISSTKSEEVILQSSLILKEEPEKVVAARMPELFTSHRVHSGKSIPTTTQKRLKGANADDLILTFSLHSSDGSPQQEVQILASQPLSDLRDALYCLHDHIGKDQSTATSLSIPDSRLDSFFFLEGVFYVDPRHRPKHDCTAPFRRWLAAQWGSVAEMDRAEAAQRSNLPASVAESLQSVPGDGEEAQPTRTSKMARLYGMSSNKGDAVQVKSMTVCRCGDVPLQLATRYLFWHRGSCEHFLYLTDRHLHRPSELHATVASSFPHVTFQKSKYHKRCSICDVMTAQFVVFGDRLSELNPSLFCEHCHHMLHYSSDGTLIYDDFTVVPYLHDV